MTPCIRPATEEVDDRSPFKQGYDACFSAGYAPPNPHPPASFDFDEWNFGWQEAERKCVAMVAEEDWLDESVAD